MRQDGFPRHSMEEKAIAAFSGTVVQCDLSRFAQINEERCKDSRLSHERCWYILLYPPVVRTQWNWRESNKSMEATQMEKRTIARMAICLSYSLLIVSKIQGPPYSHGKVLLSVSVMFVPPAGRPLRTVADLLQNSPIWYDIPNIFRDHAGRGTLYSNGFQAYILVDLFKGV